MSRDEQGPPIGGAQQANKKSKPWFAPNRSGAGFHPASWQGWLIIVVVVAAIVTVVVLLRTGML